MAPFMTFYTPTYRRPRLLERCKASVCAQSCESWQHLVLVDEIGIGVDGVFREVKTHIDQIEGQYVYFLQDDDCLAGPDVLEKARLFAKMKHDPEVIMVKNRKIGKTLPENWESEPALNGVDLGSYIVRADVFKANAHEFGQRYQGDYDFIHSLWSRYAFHWLDLLFARAQCWGLGRREEDILAADPRDTFLEIT